MQRYASSPAASNLQSSMKTGRDGSSARKSGSIARAASMAMLAFIAGAQAQTKRCDLEGRDTTINGVDHFKKCLDIATLDGKTIVVPSNVTRIDNDGLSLCKGSVQTGGDADIVYVYDNSGSMRTTYAYVNTSTNDTTYYESQSGCTDATTQGTVTFQQWNAGGTAQSAKTVTGMKSNAGCSATSGDPFNTRGRAFYLGIGDQAARAPASSAGIMSFVGNVGNVRQPTVLNNQTNIDYVRNGINAVSGGSTNYGPPLDTAKRWLTTSSITSNPKKAIIFLSDGRPNDTLYTPLLNSNMPPIYGVYLGKPNSDTLRLAQMSQRTGGQFFIIPQNKPDSLKAVVSKILNFILLEYQPSNATVTNGTLVPTQSATSAPTDFVLQSDGSWLMKLSDIVALKAQTSNAISVNTVFKEKTSGAIDNQTINFNISTTGPAATTTINLPGIPFGTNCYDRSSLTILNGGGVRPPFFSELDATYQIRVRTANTKLDSITTPAVTRLNGDAENPVIKNPTVFTDSLLFKSSGPFAIAAKTNGNGTLESALFDSIVVSWVHPRDAQDFAADTVPVRASKKQSTAYFSQTDGGAPTTLYAANVTQVFVVITDQPMDPRRTYTAVVTSEKFGIDKETVTLRQLTPGVFGAKLDISNITKTPGDNLLQVSVGGDQLRVTYKDPVDGDSAVGTAGFDENVQEEPSLTFTDENWNPLPPDAVWSPAKGKLYLVYGDDYVHGTIATETVTLVLANKKYGSVIGSDHEKITLTLDPASSGTRGTWKGSIDLADAFPAVDSNGTAETRYRGEASVSVFPHDNVGAQQTTAATDFLVIAYPDSQATIQWAMADSSKVPKGTEGLIITVKDQDFSIATNDSANVSVTCTKSGDSVSNFAAHETSPGTYVTGILVKDESAPNSSDKILSCLTTDQIVIHYVDPVYGTTTDLVVNEVAKPEANPAGKKFITSELVTLTSTTPGAQIYYTLDGTTPIPGKSPFYTDPIRVSLSTTIKAIAVKAGWKDSKIMTEVYEKQFVASHLEILDANGNQIPSGYLTGDSKNFQIKLTTTQDNLGQPMIDTRTKSAGDTESVGLVNSGFLGNSFQFWETVPLNHGAKKVVGNDTIEAVGIDTLIAKWVNPFNPVDSAVDTLIIKPAFVAAQVYFSKTEGGTPITQYDVGQDSIFVVVKTRPRDPSQTYTVTVSSSELGIDKEVLNLTELSPGVFSAKAPVGTSAKLQGNGTIEVASAGDQLTAVFVDPIYKDSYRGSAGFAQGVQEVATLEFVDAKGNAVLPDEIWNPTVGKVYVRYSDDWNVGIDSLVKTQVVKLSLVNKKSGDVVGSDDETLTLTLDTTTSTRGYWKGAIELRDRFPAKSGNDTLETYYRGELVASITPHDNGGRVLGPDIQDNLVIAYPNEPADIIIRDTSGGNVDRQTSKVDILIKDQIFTHSGDATITAEVGCAQSGDVVAKVTLVYDGTGYRIKPPLDKGELTGTTVDKQDALLMCRDADQLVVTYIDPVYLEQRTAQVNWTDDVKPDMYYASTKDGSRITSVTDALDKDFQIVIIAASPTRDAADTIDVTLTTAQGEKEVFKAVETGPLTNKFIVKADFLFQSGNPTQGNKKVEGRITQGNRVNQVIVNGTAKAGLDVLKADLTLFSSFNLVANAYIKDVNEDGRADRVFFVFDHKLTRLPSGIDEVYWNQEGSAFKQKADLNMLSFLNSDSTVVVADFSKSQFGQNLTDIPDGHFPYGLFPDDNLFGGQKANIADSVGPVIVAAVKKPSNLQSYSVSTTEKRFNPDTLIITVSENLKTSTSSFSSMLRFSKGCTDYSQSVPVKTFSEPSLLTSSDPDYDANAVKWKIIVDNTRDTQSPLVGDCVYLETDGRYSDLLANLPAHLGIPLTGENPKLVIRVFRGYPPVVGLEPSNPSFVLVNNDNRTDQTGTWSQQNGNGSWEITWIPPVGYDPADPVGSLSRQYQNFDNQQSGDRAAEVSTPVPLPRTISTVQVVASGSYKAQIHIFDTQGHFLRYMEQAYGHDGEDKNPWRATDKGQVSFLVWDLRDSQGQLAGQGAYVWKVNFIFQEKNKKSEVMYTRTGVMRP